MKLWTTRLAVLVMALVVIAPMSAMASVTTMHTAGTTAGNQFYSSVGLEFDVASGINVLELGVYDDGSNGIVGEVTLSTVLFDTATQTALAQMDFAAGDSGMWFDAGSNYLFKSLATPLTLGPGRYTLVSYGFDEGNNEHNTYHGGPGDTFDGGGLISFARSVWGSGSDVPPTFPTRSGSPDYFSGPNMRFDVPEPASVIIWSLLGTVCLGLSCWRRGRKQ